MIEVERKFLPTSEELAKLIDGAELVSKKSYTDIYFDTPAGDLIRQSIWLRSRAGRFELKIPMGNFKEKEHFTQYDEIEDEAAITAKLHLGTSNEPLAEILPRTGYLPFATIVTTRTKYKKNDLSIDVDETDYGYNMVEVEKMVDSHDHVAAAYQDILAFAAAHGIAVAQGQARGKVLEYLCRKDPARFKMIQEAWGIEL